MADEYRKLCTDPLLLAESGSQQNRTGKGEKSQSFRETLRARLRPSRGIDRDTWAARLGRPEGLLLPQLPAAMLECSQLAKIAGS